MVRLRIPLGLMTATFLMAAAALPLSPSLAAPAGSEAARKLATDRLFNSVYANDYSAVQSSIGAGADVEAVNNWGQTPADVAVDKGYFRIAHYLVSVRNFQHKGEPAAGAAAATPTAGTSATAVGESPHRTDGLIGSPKGTASPLPLAPSKVTRAAPASASASVTVPSPATPTVTSSASDTSVPDGKPDPFNPNTPAYGAQVPAASN